jgi:hypothetical protein
MVKMSNKVRLEKLEREHGSSEPTHVSIVVVPDKLSPEDWARTCGDGRKPSLTVREIRHAQRLTE